jgi:hypothetical protein
MEVTWLAVAVALASTYVSISLLSASLRPGELDQVLSHPLVYLTNSSKKNDNHLFIEIKVNPQTNMHVYSGMIWV